MLSFLRNLIWPTHQQPHHQTTPGTDSVPETASNRKRRPSGSEQHTDIKKHRSSEATSTKVGWNLDLEQADYTFSRETLAVFKGSGATVLVSRQATGAPRAPVGSANRLASFGGCGFHPGTAAAGVSDYRQSLLGNSLLLGALSPGRSGSALGVLRQLNNLPPVTWTAQQQQQHHHQAASKSTAAAATASACTQPALPQCVHSTPLIMATSGNRVGTTTSAASPAAAAAAAKPPPSTVAKRSATEAAAAPVSRSRAAAGVAATTRSDGDDDDDCVILSVEAAPKSVAEIFSPCKYLSPDWLADIKTSSQSLKTYMQKVESEETLKMQYWAKRRAADEQDLVARVTRNLKLAERELPVVPYKYEEPPPTPPPEPEPEPVVEEEEEPEFPELSDEQLRDVERAWSRQLPGSEVLAEGFSLRVTREELRSFSGLNWLNDNVVNFYMQLVAARTGPGLARVHAYSTFFYTKLSTSGYASVRRWTRKVDIFERDVLLCPVHLHNNHWTLCIVDLRSRHILFLDSLCRGGGGDPSCLPLLRQYLIEEHRDKKGFELPDASDFRLVRQIGAPQQDNGSDCGVFCCKFADYYCRGREFTFGQANMPYFRKRTTLEILQKRLLW